MELVASPRGRPNGIALSPNGKILYVGNTDEKNIRAYDLDRKGKASNERILIADLPGGPDGLKADSKGNLYITARGIQIYSPAGKHLGLIDVPGGARNCAFGDRDFRSLYITGRTTLYRVRLNVKSLCEKWRPCGGRNRREVVGGQSGGMQIGVGRKTPNGR